jgi:hypothetical protein
MAETLANVKLTATREELRAVFNKYEALLEDAFNDTKRGSEEADDFLTSLVQVEAARRVMWMEA